MRKQMKLKGQITLDSNGSLTFHSKMYEGTPFSMPVGEYDIEPNEKPTTEKPVDGWLFVTQEAKQDTKCYLTLPKPTLQFGKQILVNELQLLPLGLTIEDFKPKITSATKSGSKS